MISISVARMTETTACRLSLKHVTQPDVTRRLYEVRSGDFGMNLISYQPDPDGEQGYLMLLASPTVKANKERLQRMTLIRGRGGGSRAPLPLLPRARTGHDFSKTALRVLRYLTAGGIQFVEILNVRVDTLTSAGEDGVPLIQPG